MASNPVFSRIDKQIKEGGYVGFDRRPASPPMTGGAGPQDSLNPAQLQDLYNQPSAGPVQMGRVTLDDVVMKTLGLFSVVLIFATASWFAVAGNVDLILPLVFGGMLGGLAIGLVIAFKKTISVPLIVLYSALEGVLVGAISSMFNSSPAYQGLVTTAVIATLSTFVGMFLGWKFGLIKVTDKSRRIFGMAIMGYLLFSLANVVASFMGVGQGWGFGGNGMFGILFSVLGVGLASYSLAIDFDSVDRAVAAQMPEKYSWLLAHGLIVTLVWLYLEILRLLARLRN